MNYGRNFNTCLEIPTLGERDIKEPYRNTDILLSSFDVYNKRKSLEMSSGYRVMASQQGTRTTQVRKETGTSVAMI